MCDVHESMFKVRFYRKIIGCDVTHMGYYNKSPHTIQRNIDEYTFEKTNEV